VKQLKKETKSASGGSGCAALLMNVVPPVMDHIRRGMRSHRASGISVPQLRTLIFLYRDEGASLSTVAEHIGLGVPSISKIVDALVERKLVIRKSHPDDRRRVVLRLSAHGIDVLGQTRSKAEADLAEALKSLTPVQQDGIVEALAVLGAIFAPGKRLKAKKDA
jgi:MarR family transcriptional regulator for hemolysin